MKSSITSKINQKVTPSLTLLNKHCTHQSPSSPPNRAHFPDPTCARGHRSDVWRRVKSPTHPGDHYCRNRAAWKSKSFFPRRSSWIIRPRWSRVVSSLLECVYKKNKIFTRLPNKIPSIQPTLTHPWREDVRPASDFGPSSLPVGDVVPWPSPVLGGLPPSLCAKLPAPTVPSLR